MRRESPPNERGYRIVANCLSKVECEEILGKIHAGSISTGRGGIRHLIANPAVARLARDARLEKLAKKCLGHTAIPFRATLFEKSRNANWLVPWHQDRALPLARRFELPGWGPWSEKGGVTYAHAPAWALSRVVALRIHLDASSADNGPLRVIPGSHLEGVHGNASIREFVSTRDSVECGVPLGGVIVVRPLIIHSSPKARSSSARRVLHIEYADSLDLGAGIRLAVV